MPRFKMRDHLAKELGYSISDEAYDIFLKLAKTFKQLTKNVYLLQYQKKYVEHSKAKVIENPCSDASSMVYRYDITELIRMEKRIEDTLPKRIAQLKIDLVYALHAEVDDPRATELKIDEILKEFYSYT